MKKVLVITDNIYLLKRFRELIFRLRLNADFDFARSPGESDNSLMRIDGLRVVNIKRDWKREVEGYDLVISVHCKQIFPAAMTKSVRCVNVHPGLNPYNRGWYPQVFSIINGLPWGATIHEVDEKLDHGKIIIQEEMELHSWDTSLSAYTRVLDKEIELLERALPKIVAGRYSGKLMEEEGNINVKKDFKELCTLNLNENLTMRDAINRLRALSHGKYNNAFFHDDSGNKVYVRLILEKADD